MITPIPLLPCRGDRVRREAAVVDPGVGLRSAASPQRDACVACGTKTCTSVPRRGRMVEPPVMSLTSGPVRSARLGMHSASWWLSRGYSGVVFAGYSAVCCICVNGCGAACSRPEWGHGRAVQTRQPDRFSAVVRVFEHARDGEIPDLVPRPAAIRVACQTSWRAVAVPGPCTDLDTGSTARRAIESRHVRISRKRV